MCKKVVSFLKSYWLYVFVFVVASLLRFVPELFSSVYPAGVDVPFYIFELKLMERGLSWDHLYFGNPLPYLLLLTLRGVTGLDWFVFFKFFTPLLNGCVVVSFLYFLRNGLALDWSNKKYLVATLFMVFSSSGIIMSNGLVKQQLAMIFFFLFLVAYKRHSFKLELLFAVLVCLCHLVVPLVLFAFLVADFVYGMVRHEESRRDVTVVLFVLAFTIFVITFLLPSLEAVNFLEEVSIHVSSYFSGSSYGIRYTIIPIWDRVFGHFVWYYGLWIGFLILGYSQFWRNRLVNVLLLVLLPLGFIPVGTIWGRFHWLLAYPFAILLVGGTEKAKILRYTFLVFVLVNGCLLVSDLSWSMARSSVPFEEIPLLRGNYDLIVSNLTNNSLIIDSTVSFAWTNLWLCDDNKEVSILSARTVRFFLNDDCLWLSRDGLKGHAFYVFRVNRFSVSLDSYDRVFVINVDRFSVNNPFNDYWQYFKYYGEYNGEIVYEYCG